MEDTYEFLNCVCCCHDLYDTRRMGCYRHQSLYSFRVHYGSSIRHWVLDSLAKNVVENASFGPGFITICIALLLVHLGTLMNLRELLAQWKAVCIALLGVCGTLLLTLTVGTLIFDWKTVVAAVPPLTGGLVSALLMSNGLKAQGLASLVALPVAMFVIHSVVGYPLTSVLLKQESHRLLKHFRANGSKLDPNVPKMRRGAEEVKDNRPKLLNLPEKYQTSAFIMARVAIVGLLAMGFGTLTNNVINSNVVCLIFGVIAHQIGFLEDNALNKAGVFNWLILRLTRLCLWSTECHHASCAWWYCPQIIVPNCLGRSGHVLSIAATC